MKVARILVLGVALAAGGAAALLIGPGDEKKSQAPRAKGTIDTLSLAVRSLFASSKITEGDTDRETASAPFALVSAGKTDAS